MARLRCLACQSQIQTGHQCFHLIGLFTHTLFLPQNSGKQLQGAKKTVSTCPRQVVLASGQVGYQSYLSFGQVNLQKINKNKVS